MRTGVCDGRIQVFPFTVLKDVFQVARHPRQVGIHLAPPPARDASPAPLFIYDSSPRVLSHLDGDE